MTYRNGRTAAEGDRVLWLTTGQTGLIHSLTEAATGNARLTLSAGGPTDPIVSQANCLLLADIAAAFPAPPPNPPESDR